MKIERGGVILFTKLYEECVAFYADVLGLEILFTDDELTCFEYGAAYLMVERGGVLSAAEKTRAQNPTCIRFNVKDVKGETTALREKGLKINYQEHSWGVIAQFFDPDGNLCSLRDEKMFVKQIDERKMATEKALELK